jgi:hypothetical protein
MKMHAMLSIDLLVFTCNSASQTVPHDALGSLEITPGEVAENWKKLRRND